MFFSLMFSQRTLLSLFPASNPRALNNVTKPFLLQVSSFNKFCETTELFTFEHCLSLVQSRLGESNGSGHGESVHCFCVKTGWSSDVFVQNNIIRLYSHQSDLKSACKLFDEIPDPNLVSCTSMISSHVHEGQYDVGLRMFKLMFRYGFVPNEFGFSLALKSCRHLRDLVTGLVIHGQILKSGFESDIFCSSSILGIYLDSGKIHDAYKFFDLTPLKKRSEASWNTLIYSLFRMSNGDQAVDLFRKMRLSGVSLNGFTYSIILKLCSSFLVFSQLGQSIHGEAIKRGFKDDVVVSFSLVDFYSKLGFVDASCRLFQDLKEKDNMVWCSFLSGFHQIGDSNRGLRFYLLFLSEGNKPDPFTFSIAFSLCSSLETVSVGTQIHCSLVKHGFVIDSILGISLINMYGNFSMVWDSYKCFHGIKSKDETCFAAMINCLVLNSYNEEALEIFSEMNELGFESSQSALSCILRALGDLHMLKQGKTLHCCIVKSLGDFDSKLSIENGLIEMYGKCNKVDSAEKVFERMRTRNEFSWTALMVDLGQIGKFDHVLELFRRMLLRSNSKLEKPSSFTAVSVLQACAKSESLSEGKQVHGYITKSGFSSYPFVQSALISVYSISKTEILSALRAFSSSIELDLVSWSTMLTALVQNGYHEEALKSFSEHNIKITSSADESVFSVCLSACADMAALQSGKCFHACVTKVGLDSNLHVASSIIDMYSKCGCINEAQKIFDDNEDRNLVTWTAMISGYAYNGLGIDSVRLFDRMKETGLRPDWISLIGLLTACSHSGLVAEGWEFFNSMRSEYGIEANVTHYACIVDLLGRNEQVEWAESVIENAPFELSSKYLLFRTLLGACNTHGNVEVGDRIARKMFELRPKEPSTYVLMSNIYASVSMWDHSVGVRSRMKEADVVKHPGSSWIHLA